MQVGLYVTMMLEILPTSPLSNERFVEVGLWCGWLWTGREITPDSPEKGTHEKSSNGRGGRDKAE